MALCITAPKELIPSLAQATAKTLSYDLGHVSENPHMLKVSKDLKLVWATQANSLNWHDKVLDLTE